MFENFGCNLNVNPTHSTLLPHTDLFTTEVSGHVTSIILKTYRRNKDIETPSTISRDLIVFTTESSGW